MTNFKTRLAKLEAASAMRHSPECPEVGIWFRRGDGSLPEVIAAMSSDATEFRISRDPGETVEDFKTRAFTAFAKRCDERGVKNPGRVLIFQPAPEER